MRRDSPSESRRDAVGPSPARWPRYLDAWAQLGMLARDDTEAYACFRVGYHRGLDRLRANGWRGSGYVRWQSEENRGFLRALRGLGQTAARIGEDDEAERCAHFLMQCDPAGVPERDRALNCPNGGTAARTRSSSERITCA